MYNTHTHTRTHVHTHIRTQAHLFSLILTWWSACSWLSKRPPWFARLIHCRHYRLFHPQEASLLLLLKGLSSFFLSLSLSPFFLRYFSSSLYPSVKRLSSILYYCHHLHYSCYCYILAARLTNVASVKIASQMISSTLEFLFIYYYY